VRFIGLGNNDNNDAIGVQIVSPVGGKVVGIAGKTNVAITGSDSVVFELFKNNAAFAGGAISCTVDSSTNIGTPTDSACIITISFASAQSIVAGDALAVKVTPNGVSSLQVAASIIIETT